LKREIHKVLIAGNRFVRTTDSAIDFFDMQPTSSDIVLANNTLFDNRDRGLGIFDDHQKQRAFLSLTGIRYVNNLVLSHRFYLDQCVIDHEFEQSPTRAAGDLKGLKEAKGWQFGYNWYEPPPPLRGDKTHFKDYRIPPSPMDRLEESIKVISRLDKNPGFVRPEKDSPLATAGAGGPNANPVDNSLPPYVGAVPPQGVEPWDWDKTWKAMVR